MNKGGWDLINAANMKDKFMDMVKTMDMSFSYKPVLLKAMLKYVDEDGRVLVEDIALDGSLAMCR